MSKILIDEAYRPKEDEPFMNERQREYFRRKLIKWKGDILRGGAGNAGHPPERKREPSGHRRPGLLGDRSGDRAARARPSAQADRQDRRGPGPDRGGTYGYCEETGEPISLKRLEARPIATLSLEAQERHERNERVYRDD